MGGIAEKRRALAHPRSARVDRRQGVFLPGKGRGDELARGAAPGGEAGVDLGGLAVDVPAGLLPRLLDDGDDVHGRSLCHRVGDQMGLGAEPQADAGHVGPRWRHVGRDERAPGRAPDGFGRGAARDRLALRRPHPVGADQCRGLHHLAAVTVLEADEQAVGLELGVFDGRAEVETDRRHAPDRGGEHRLQVGAVDDAVGETVAPAEGAVRHRGQPSAADTVQYVDGAGLQRRLRHRPVEAEAGEHATGIGADLDAGADLAEFVLALGDDHAEAGGGEGKRRGQPAGAGAGDDDRWPFAPCHRCDGPVI